MVEVLRRYANSGTVRNRLVRALKTKGQDSRVERTRVTPPPVRVRLPNSLQPEIVAAYLAGASTRQLGERYGCSKAAIETMLHRAGTKMRKQPLTPEQVKDAKRLHATGLSTYKIASQFGVAQCTVWRALR